MAVLAGSRALSSRSGWHDLIRFRGQVVTITLVIAAGIASFVTMRGNYTSLEAARDRFYDQQRFGDVFVQVERAPESVRSEIAALPGVAHVESRIVKPAMLPLPQLSEPVRGLVVSLSPVPQLNLVHLRDGRLPEPDHSDEAVLLQGFADAHRTQLGDRIPVVINGKKRLLQIVGIAASPECVMAMAAGSMSSDPERFVRAAHGGPKQAASAHTHTTEDRPPHIIRSLLTLDRLSAHTLSISEHAARETGTILWSQSNTRRPRSAGTGRFDPNVCSGYARRNRRTQVASGLSFFYLIVTRSLAARPKTSGWYISSARVGGTTKVPRTVARASTLSRYVPGVSSSAKCSDRSSRSSR